jgi:cobalt transporter subunit CbtB
MSHAPVVIDHAAAPANAATASNIKAAVLSCALAIGLLYGMGFAPMEALHNAAHDSRHSAGFPCH